MVFFWIFNILELIKRLESSPRLGQVVQECLYLAEKFRSKQYIANSALDTISARLNLAASVSSLASLDSSCITIQVIYHSVRLPTACPYNRQAVPGWTCLPGPIKSSLTSENVHKLGYGQSHWWLSADLLLIEHCSVLSLLRPACHSRLHPPTSAPSPAALRHQFCKQPALYIETKKCSSFKSRQDRQISENINCLILRCGPTHHNCWIIILQGPIRLNCVSCYGPSLSPWSHFRHFHIVSTPFL